MNLPTVQSRSLAVPAEGVCPKLLVCIYSVVLTNRSVKQISELRWLGKKESNLSKGVFLTEVFS